jgi:hypothetical protein
MIRRIVLILFVFSPVFAGDILVVCPYPGALINKVVTSHQGYTLSLKDDAFLEGIFFQWIRPSDFQVNTFLYHSSNINYSTVWGGHIMGDVYFLASQRGTFAVGAGSEIISINMNAGSNPMPLTGGGYTGFSDFKMQNTVYTPFVRALYKFTPVNGVVKLSVFPWAGGQYQGVRGKMTVDFPVFQSPMQEGITADDWYALTGLGVTANILHFIDLEAKYHATYDTKTYYATASAMAFFFFTRHIGLSYRFKYMELSNGSNYLPYGRGGICSLKFLLLSTTFPPQNI